MIKKLTSAPVLQALDVNKDYFLFCDASLFGTGFAMFQASNENPEHELRVIGYGAQALNPSQKSWTILQLEMLAVYHALRVYEPYCRHRQVTVFSDNISLVYLKGLAMGSPREKRMASFLMGFQLNFRHLSGKANVLADSLSRCFVDMDPTEREQWIPTVDPKDDFLFNISRHFQSDLANNQSVIADDDRPRTIQTMSPSVTNASWLSYCIAFKDANPNDTSLKVTNKNLHCTTISRSPPAADNTQNSITDSQGQHVASTSRADHASMSKHSPLRAEATPFYPASTITCQRMAQTAHTTEQLLPAARDLSPVVITQANLSECSATVDDSSNDAVDIWYDCATELTPDSVLTSTVSQQSA